MSGALVKYEAARRALAEAHGVDEVKDIRDKAAAMEAYARQAKDTELLSWATEIKVRAERRAGEMLRDMEKAKAGRPANNNQSQRATDSRGAPTLSDLGVTKSQSSRWQQVAALPEDKFERFLSDAREKGEQITSSAVRQLTNERRAKERLDNIKEISLGNEALSLSRRYPVVYADPPWRYENPPIGATNRSIENHYPTMGLEEICALPVRGSVTDDAVLFMWATVPKLDQCMNVIDAWGFLYRTGMVWVKDKIGMGYYVRNQHELLLIARRGKMPPPPIEARCSSVITAPRLAHSAKPPECYEIIERMYPDMPRVELFQREPREGWDGWGNQARVA